MLNKKSQVEVLAIILFVVILVGFIILVNFRDNSRTEDCRFDCTNKYNAIFVDYKPSGYAHEECWCRQEDKPIRIW